MPTTVKRKKKRRSRRRKNDFAILLASVVTALLLILFAAVIWWLFHPSMWKSRDEVSSSAVTERTFTRGADDRITCSDPDYTVVSGIDVSNHQTGIDWSAVHGDGMYFAYIRIGYRGYGTGKMVADDSWITNLEAASAAGLKTGVYFYSQAITEEEASEEAAFVLELLGDRTTDLPVIFDWEKPAVEGPRTENITNEEVAGFCRVFCSAITASGRECGIYMNRNKLEIVSGYGLPDDAVIWVAQYSDEPTTSSDYTIWQYTNSGTVDGIDGVVDLDLMLIPKSE